MLIAIAFGAATRVANTREGLIAEVVTLLAGLAGMTLVFFGLFSGARPAPKPSVPRPAAPARPPSARDFALGAAGLGFAVILIGGWGISAGWQWAALSVVVLLPMVVGSAVLCIRFLRAR
ncbi:MAG TPA: hypothetical protein VGR34_03445 [Candidatus Dormibacteraeota bacterium]|nr:hypothetical protein [Candidatus Dormibacteraeota bacterium]